MINVEANSILCDPSLQKLTEQIESMNYIISCQQEEISKSEESISQFHNCLKKQNEVLNMYQTEKEKLKEAKSKRIKLTQVCDMDYREIYESVLKMGVQCKNKRRINRESLKFFEKDFIKSESNMSENTDCADRSTKSNATLEKPMKRIKIAQIADKTINKIVMFGDEIYIGGSGGLLLKYKPPSTTKVFSTETEDDILQIEIVKRAQTFCLVAFTNKNILIYDAVRVSRRAVYLPGIGTVFNDLSLIYIPLSGGVVKKLYIDDYRILDHVVHGHGNLCSYVPGKGKNKDALVRIQGNSLLYVTDKKELKNLEPVTGVRDVKRIVPFRYSNYLCYSTNTIWFFNSEFEIIDTLKFPEGIKFMEVTSTSAAVIDLDNTVHIYPLPDSGSFGLRTSSRRIDEGDVTALSVVKKNVLLAVGCDIIVLENIL